MEGILELLEHGGWAISLVSVAVIVAGFALAAGRYPSDWRSDGPESAFNGFKIRLGKTLILGLEMLVVADVIETITITPTLGSLAGLAALVILRTIVSWTLTLEVEGRWPWQPEAQEGQDA